MATFNVYDNNTGLTRSITVDIDQATIAGSGFGGGNFYVTVSTSARAPDGGTIPPIIITSFVDDLTTDIKNAILVLFRHIMGEFLSSSSSSSVTESFSSQTGDGVSSQSSESSASTRLADESSSSESTASPSSVTSVSSVTESLSSASSLSSFGESSNSSASLV